MKATSRSSTPFLNELAGFGLLIVLWAVLSLFFPVYIIPSPVEVLQNLPDFLNARFFAALAITLWRIFVGFSISILIGTALATLLSNTKLSDPVSAMVQAFQVIPAVTVGVILVIVFGVGSAPPILLITLMTLPLIFMNTLQALKFPDPKQVEYLDSIKADRKLRFSTLMKPQIIRITRINLILGFSMASKIAVTGEFIGSQDGLGYLLNKARLVFAMKEVFFYILLFILLTVLFQGLVELVYATFLRKYTYGD